MAADVDICNLALVTIGARRIMAITDNDKNARELNAIYVMERENELRAHTWGFSISRAWLPALASPPVTPPPNITPKDKWYQLPPDYLKLIFAGPQAPGLSLTDYRGGDEQDYRIEGSTIVSHWPSPLFIRYVRRVTDPTQFDSSFVVAFAMKLAMAVCEQINGNSQKVQQAEKAYEMAIQTALHANAIEKPPVPLPDSSWVWSRLT